MTTIHAELTAGDESIVLVAGGLGPLTDVAGAAKLLQTLTPLFAKSDPPGALVVPATWPAVVQLSATYGDAFRPQARLAAWIADQAQRRTVPGALTYTPPAGLTPFSWQSAGAAMIAATGRALFTDEPGTGKTITAILGVVEHLERADAGPVVVVCPASVIDAWVEAWTTWAPHVRAIAWRGSPKIRHALAGTADVYVCSYETARIDTPILSKPSPLLKMKPAHLVIDECHLVKNHNAARSKSVSRLAKAANKAGGAIVALSGTPITRHPGDLWPTLEALMPDAWPSRERWVRRYCLALEADYGESEILGLEPAREAEFRLTLLGQHRRIRKADVLKELPPKVYSVRTVELPAKWRKVYDDFEDTMLAELPDGSELSVMDVMSKFGHLYRLASAAADVEITYGPDVDEITGLEKRHVSLDLKAPSWKADALLEILAERPGQPVIAAAQSSQLIRVAGEMAAAEGLRVGYVIGGQSAAERTATVKAFQAGDLDLIGVTTGAGGTGITLTAAKTLVFLQRPWSLVESIQMEDRAHRIGSEQHDAIEIIDIVAKNTIDTRVRTVLRDRAGQLADVVQDPDLVAELLGGSGLKAAS